MSKKHAKTQTTAATTETAAPQQKETLYKVVASKRPLTGTKFASGNERTHAALFEAAAKNGGVLTHAQAMEACAALNHKAFLAYAINRLRIVVPVVDAPQPADVAAQQNAA